MRLRALPPAVLIAFLCASTCAHTQNISYNDLVAQAPELVRLQNEFEQKVIPGVVIEAKEVYRKGTSGKDLEVRYNFRVGGVPVSTVFRQVQFPVSQDKAVPGITGISLNSDGLMICAGRTSSQCHSGGKFDVPVPFTQTELLKGEPRRSVFLAAHNLKIPISVVPDPIQSVDKGCRLSAVRLTAKFELAYIEGSGFPPSKDVHLRLSNDQSTGTAVVDGEGGVSTPHAGETNVTVTADDKGAIQTAALMNASRNPSGTETIQVTDPACGPRISYQWGIL